MGTFRHRIEIGDPEGRRFEAVDALVDTGANYTMAPFSMLQRLGVTPIDRATFILGDSRRVERDIGRTWIRVDGRLEITLVVFGDEQLGAVLGAYSLEGLRLGVDPVSQRLVPTPGLLMLLER